MHAALSIVGFFVLIGLNAYGDSSCTDTSYHSLLECAQSRSPEIQSALLEVERAKSFIGVAEQWRNPELSVGSIQGKVGSDDRRETDFSLGIPIELGGRISARRTAAQSELALAQAKLYLLRAKVRSETLTKLHRLRQVLREHEIVEEAIATFSKLLGQYASRPQLSPEQQTSATVFQLAKEDYSLKRANILDEVSALNTFFVLNLGYTNEQIKKKLPVWKDWPAPSETGSPQSSPEFKILQSELERSLAEISVARSESWPALTLGPAVKQQTESGQNNQLIGINVSLSLPVFNMNAGARAVAATTAKLSEIRKKSGLLQLERERRQVMEIYGRSVHVLKTGLSINEIERRHVRAEKLFQRGVVASALVIEAHRSFFEVEKARHERELRALEALLQIHTIDGTILEVSL